jgi:hypothetical protein
MTLGGSDDSDDGDYMSTGSSLHDSSLAGLNNVTFKTELSESDDCGTDRSAVDL